MIGRFFGIFRRKGKASPQPLRIEGVGEAPLTAEPDDAELAAQALLESLAGREPAATPSADDGRQEDRDGRYYRRLADKIRIAHDAATLRTRRFVSFCEQQLQNQALPAEGKGSLAMLEAELFKRIDTVDREGGELKRRWQRCLAEVTVRLMQATQATVGDNEAT